MARRSLHLAISALVLLALLLSARLSAPAAQASPLAGKLHISLLALYHSPIIADVNEPVQLAAHTNTDSLAKDEFIIVAEVLHGKLSLTHRITACDKGEAGCAATDTGGEEGELAYKAVVVKEVKGKKLQALAKSNTVAITRKKLSLTLQVSDKAGTLQDGKQLAGVNTTFTLLAPEGAASSWAAVAVFQRQTGDSTWTPAGSTSCALDVKAFICSTTRADEYDASQDADNKVTYEAQALDTRRHVVLASDPQTISWTRWPLQVTVNGKGVTNDKPPQVVALSRNDQAKIEVTTPVQKLQLADQQFEISFISRLDNRLFTCTALPCMFTDDPPPPDCGDCSKPFAVAVEDNSGDQPGPLQRGETDFTVRWLRTGYQFSGLSYHSEITEGPCPNGQQSCAVTVTDSRDTTISGYVCGNPYSDPWKITANYHIVVTNTANPQESGTSDNSTSNDKVTFDKTTGESNLTSGESDPTLYAFLLVFPYAAALGKHTPLSPYVHFKLAGTPSADGTLTAPTSAELQIHVPNDLVNYYIPNPGANVNNGFLYGGSGFDQDLSAPVTTKDDCP